MGTRDERIDAYIARSADFAKPILTHFREIVHQGCPDVVETMKWSMPSFEYHGMLCHMAAFKAHCAIGFWKGSLLLPDSPKEGMGNLGKITSLEDLPPKKELLRLVKEAARLNEEGVMTPRKAKAAKPELETPDDLLKALAKKRNAQKGFDELPPSHRREYVEWITEAKRPETRAKRIAQTVELVAAGKSMNWKYS